MRDSKGQCSGKGPFLARSSRCAFPKGGLRRFSDAWRAYLANASSFWMHGGDMLPRTGDFPVRGHFWDAWSEKLATDCRPGTHRARILPLLDSEERTTAKYCHGRPPSAQTCALRARPCAARGLWGLPRALARHRGAGRGAMLLVAPTQRCRGVCGARHPPIVPAPQCRTLPLMRGVGRCDA